jgi:surfactin synthase thioesterase subunit
MGWTVLMIDLCAHHPWIRNVLDLMLPILRADFEVCETYDYRPARPLACRISTYCGRRDPRCRTDLVAAWRAETPGTFTSRFLPGTISSSTVRGRPS